MATCKKHKKNPVQVYDPCVGCELERLNSMEHFNRLTPAEAERISLLMEECGEVIQVCGKILRHGYESYHPDDPSKKTNRQLLEKELGHVNFAQGLMCKRDDLLQKAITDSMRLKNLRVGGYLHHQGD